MNDRPSEITDECPGVCQLTGERCPPECNTTYQPCAKARTNQSTKSAATMYPPLDGLGRPTWVSPPSTVSAVSPRVEAATLAYSLALAKRGDRQFVRYDDIAAALRAADFISDFVDPGMS